MGLLGQGCGVRGTGEKMDGGTEVPLIHRIVFLFVIDSIQKQKSVTLHDDPVFFAPPPPPGGGGAIIYIPPGNMPPEGHKYYGSFINICF